MHVGCCLLKYTKEEGGGVLLTIYANDNTIKKPDNSSR
jgi:hypothetical protein